MRSSGPPADERAGGPLDPALPGWAYPRAELDRLARQAAEQLASLLDVADTDRVTRRPPPELIEAWQTKPVPEQGRPVGDVLAEFSETIAPYPFGNGHPRFAAWVNSPPHPLGVAAAGLAAAMNPSVAGGNHAAVHVERQVVRWFAGLLGWTEGYIGQFTSGGSAATLTALAAARHQALSRAGWDVRRAGLAGFGQAAVYADSEAHSCVTKAVETLGIGSQNLVQVGCDDQRRLAPAALDRQLTADRAAGRLPIAVVATAGTVNTGAVDPLDDLARVCARHGVWLHVDAAYGGPAILLLPDWASERAGLARADSIGLDPHKWLYTPVDAGLVLLRDEPAARDTFSLVPAYLRTSGDAEEPVWFSEYSLEQTRPFRALKVWMQLQHIGLHGYRRLIARDIAVADHLRERIVESSDFDLLAAGLSVVCFRHRPLHTKITPDDAETAIDAHNQRLLRALQSRGHAYVAGTRVDDRFALRACVVNPHTTTAHMDALIDEVRRCAALRKI